MHRTSNIVIRYFWNRLMIWMWISKYFVSMIVLVYEDRWLSQRTKQVQLKWGWRVQAFVHRRPQWPTFLPHRISQHNHILYSLIVRKSRCGSPTLHFLPRTRPVSVLPLSFTTAAVSGVSQISSFLQILKASYSLRHDCTVTTVQLADSFDISNFNIASYPRNHDYGWRSWTSRQALTGILLLAPGSRKPVGNLWPSSTLVSSPKTNTHTQPRSVR